MEFVSVEEYPNPIKVDNQVLNSLSLSIVTRRQEVVS